MSDVVVEGLANLLEFFLARIIGPALLVGLGAVCFKFRQILLELDHPLAEGCLALFLELTNFLAEFFFQLRHLTVAGLRVDADDHVGGEVNNLLEVFGRHIQQVAQTAWHTFEVPNVGHRCG